MKRGRKAKGRETRRREGRSVVGTSPLTGSLPPCLSASLHLCLLAFLPPCLLPALSGCAAGAAGGAGSLFGPKGTPWTIRCLELEGPYQAQRVGQIAETLRRTPGIRPDDVLVRDESDGFTRLYYGTYYRRTNPKSGKRSMPAKMRQDVDLIRQLGTGSGTPYFLQAMPVRMPTPDVGNPQWALGDVPATYSLQVAVFEPTDDFWEYKEAAAKYCELLREKGHEAYYHHGSACSMVTVGAFGPDAVITRPDGRTYYSSKVLALQRDRLLKYNLLNGRVYRVRDGSGASVPVSSQLVEIPHRTESDRW